ncbi:hypothetical protein BDW74DRAFT_25933 [Aspergillus multicolor]|uniref:uncharacterized protein n=1 Tax=Aspergillus multicolor TaxID=41759 RepID=UPI003CCDDA39
MGTRSEGTALAACVVPCNPSAAAVRIFYGVRLGQTAVGVEGRVVYLVITRRVGYRSNHRIVNAFDELSVYCFVKDLLRTAYADSKFNVRDWTGLVPSEWLVCGRC